MLLLSGSHPLAGAAHIMPEQLAPYTEVVHADYDMPIYPYSDYRYSGGRTADRRKNVIFIYDRGTLMEMLSNVHGSYIWTTPTEGCLRSGGAPLRRGANPGLRCDTVSNVPPPVPLYPAAHRQDRGRRPGVPDAVRAGIASDASCREILLNSCDSAVRHTVKNRSA